MKVIFKCIAGSRMFGVHSEESDYDYKGVYLLPLSERLKKQKNAATNTQISINESEEMFHFEAFLNLVKEGQTIPFEMLFCPPELIIESSPLWDFLISNRNKLVHKNIVSFYQMAKRQAYRYSEKGKRIQSLLALREFLNKKDKNSKLGVYESEINSFVKNNPVLSYKGEPILFISEKTYMNRVEKFVNISEIKLGYNHKIFRLIEILDSKLSQYGERSLLAFKNDSTDYKALSHCVRISIEAKELLLTNKITLPLKKNDLDLVKDIKYGKITKEKIFSIIETNFLELEKLLKTSLLQEVCDINFINKLLDDYRKGII